MDLIFGTTTTTHPTTERRPASFLPTFWGIFWKPFQTRLFPSVVILTTGESAASDLVVDANAFPLGFLPVSFASIVWLPPLRTQTFHNPTLLSIPRASSPPTPPPLLQCQELSDKQVRIAFTAVWRAAGDNNRAITQWEQRPIEGGGEESPLRRWPVSVAPANQCCIYTQFSS